MPGVCPRVNGRLLRPRPGSMRGLGAWSGGGAALTSGYSLKSLRDRRKMVIRGLSPGGMGGWGLSLGGWGLSPGGWGLSSGGRVCGWSECSLAVGQVFDVAFF